MTYNNWQDTAAKFRHQPHELQCCECHRSMISTEEGWYFPQNGNMYCPLCWIKSQ